MNQQNVERLEFGNVNQIVAVKYSREKLAEQDKRNQAVKDGIVKQYLVRIEFSGCVTQRVWALSEEDAEEMITDESFEPDDFDIDCVRAREMK